MPALRTEKRFRRGAGITGQVISVDGGYKV
jgi:hypothetical protein